MSTSRELELITNISPSIELVDDMVRAFHAPNTLASGCTDWIKPTPFVEDSQNHFSALTKIAIINSAWTVMTFRRDVGEYGFHYKSIGNKYTRVDDQIIRDTVSIGRNGYRPVVTAQEYQVPVKPEEVFSHLINAWPMPEWRKRLTGISPNTERHDPHSGVKKRAIDRGSFVMRLAELRYLNESPKIKN